MSQLFKQARNFFNRELSWLKFNERVLEEAEDTSHPLLERLKFLAIFTSNLDEFFMIRVAGLKEQVAAGVHGLSPDGLSPSEQLEHISQTVHRAVERQSRIFTEDILPLLRKKGIRIRSINNLREAERTFLHTYFREQVFPVLTPLAVDPTHPFPQLRGLGMNLMVELRAPKRHESKIAVIHVPAILPRLVHIPAGQGLADFVPVEDIVRKHAAMLFPNMKILSIAEFRVTRNADLDLSEAEADDLLKLIERELRKRRLGTVIRLEVSKQISPANRSLLQRITGLQAQDVYDIPTYLDLTGFMQLMDQGVDTDLRDPAFTPARNQRIVRGHSIFETIAQGDLLLYHPYESFNPVVEFIEEASKDPQVLAIKQTLYRTSGRSSIVRALKTAVNNGKQVTALIELKARFDEENNIEWAKELDRAGVSVVYGVLGLKTHCKLAMVVRKEGTRIRRYLHLSTGNYNERTARIYTDMSLMTCDEEMGEDASALFNLLTGYSLQKIWKRFFIAPATLRGQIAAQIEACIRHHSTETPSRIILVINSLVDPDMICLLYKASQAGVQLDLVVRGICCLRPGVKGLSENITVKSIVGRFLEHTRIFYFKSQGQSKIYLGSADLMQRNLNRRVEIVFPVLDPQIKRRVREVIQRLLDDRAKSRYLQPDGSYLRRTGQEAPFDAQQYFLKEALSQQEQVDTIRGQ
ncbi:MAG: polyphosphate kinase 1 [Bacteroidia bacterium]